MFNCNCLTIILPALLFVDI